MPMVARVRRAGGREISHRKVGLSGRGQCSFSLERQNPDTIQMGPRWRARMTMTAVFQWPREAKTWAGPTKAGIFRAEQFNIFNVFFTLFSLYQCCTFSSVPLFHFPLSLHLFFLMSLGITL